jgi:hypothetical protein
MKTALSVCLFLIGAHAHGHAAPRLYEIGMHRIGVEEHFFVKTSLAAFIKDAEAELKLPVTERRKLVTGLVAHVQGNGGFNGKWNWHMHPDSVGTAEMSMEVCDLRPSQVNWTQGWYCPWDSFILREVVSSSLEQGAAPEGRANGGAPGDVRLTDEAGPGGSHRMVYTLASSGRTELELRTLDGKRAATLVDAHRAPGRYQVTWNDRGLPRGLHYLILKHDGKPASTRAILLR